MRSIIKLTLELRESGENPEHEPTICSCRVDVSPLPCQDFQTNAALREIVDGVDEVAEVASEPVKLPDHERIAFPQRF